MKATQLLHNLGQSIWLDNITRDLLDSGTLKRYIDELSVTRPPQSHYLQSCHQKQFGLRCSHPPEVRRRQVRRNALF